MAVVPRLPHIRISGKKSSRARSRLVVIGNGMVGYKFCEYFVQSGLNEQYDLTIFGEETKPAYDRVHLSRYFHDSDSLNFWLAPVSWYHENYIHLHLGNPVVRIDRGAKNLLTANGAVHPYDTLVMATGSQPYIPPIEGADQTGVFAYRTVQDLDDIRLFAEKKKKAAVIGGGLLGLEAAKALQDLGLDLCVIEIADFLMPQQLNQPAAETLRQEIVKLNIQVWVGKRTHRIQKAGHELCLHFHDGEKMNLDLVVIAAGIRPRDELAKASDLRCGTSRMGGIVVDDRLRTSDENIYAIGECACHRGNVYGFVTPGYEMAQVLTGNLAGRRSLFSPNAFSCRLKMMGVEVAHLGHGLQPGDQYVYRNENTYRHCVFEYGRIIGAVSVGEWKQLPRIQEAIKQRLRLSQRERQRFLEEGDFWPHEESCSFLQSLPDHSKICTCMNVTKGALCQAVRNGCTTVDSLALATGASTVCGSCKSQLAELAGIPHLIVDPNTKGKTVFILSILGFFFTLLLLVMESLPYAATVQSAWRSVDVLWRDSLLKQISGFSLLGLSAIALLFSLRKRWKRFAWGDFQVWRCIHVAVGIMSLLGIPLHTGFSWGRNFNFLFMTTFLLFCASGVLAGLILSLENTQKLRLQRWATLYKPRLIHLHIYLFWPIPVLIVFHILCVYYF